MDRTFKFRGISLKTGKWIYGIPVRSINGVYVVPSTASDGIVRLTEDDRVDEASLGEYTNISDKRGNEVYEGDILEYYNHKYVVAVRDGYFCLKRFDCLEDAIYGTSNSQLLNERQDISQLYEIVGNIYEQKQNGNE